MTTECKEETTDAVAKKLTEYTDALQGARYLRDYIWMSPKTFEGMYGKGSDSGEVLRLLSDKVMRLIGAELDIFEFAAVSDDPLADELKAIAHEKEILAKDKTILACDRRIADLDTEVADLNQIIIKLKAGLGECDQMITDQAKEIATLTADNVKLTSEVDDFRKDPTPPAKVTPEKPHPSERTATGKRAKSSKYFGVSTAKSKCNPWRAQVWSNGKNSQLGMFPIEEEAAIAVQEFFGNTSEAQRIREILAAKQPTAETSSPAEIKKQPAKVKVTIQAKVSPAIETINKRAQRINVERINQAGAANRRKEKDAEAQRVIDERHEQEAAEDMEKLKGNYAKQWQCKGCGWSPEVAGAPDTCPKCVGGDGFEQINVLQPTSTKAHKQKRSCERQQ